MIKMRHSVRLLTRLGVAIEKIGQHVSKIGRRAQVHAQSGANVGLGRAVEVEGNASQANTSYAVGYVALGDQVNKNSGLSFVKNLEGVGANSHLASIAAHLRNPPDLGQRQSFGGNNLELLNRQYSAAQLRNFPRKESSGGDK